VRSNNKNKSFKQVETSATEEVVVHKSRGVGFIYLYSESTYMNVSAGEGYAYN